MAIDRHDFLKTASLAAGVAAVPELVQASQQKAVQIGEPRTARSATTRSSRSATPTSR